MNRSKIGYTWTLMRYSLGVLCKDKELLLFFIVPAVILVFMMIGMVEEVALRHFYYALLICYCAAVFLVISTLETIFRAALYCHVRQIETPGEILPYLASGAIVAE